MNDPFGASSAQVYDDKYFYLISNGQFYNDPDLCRGKKSFSAAWANSKRMLAWNDNRHVECIEQRRCERASE